MTEILTATDPKHWTFSLDSLPSPMSYLSISSKGKIQIRDHPLKTLAFFSIFLTSTPLQSAIFFTTIRRQIWQILDPSTLKNADILTLSGTEQGTFTLMFLLDQILSADSFSFEG